MAERLTSAERRTINAAKKWRTVYYAWRSSEERPSRDLSTNGENLALSKLLDALQALDKERGEQG